MKLSQLKCGESGFIKEIEPQCKMRERMWDMGLVRGTEVTVIHDSPFNGPIEIMLRGYRLVLRRDDAESIIIMPEKFKK